MPWKNYWIILMIICNSLVREAAVIYESPCTSAKKVSFIEDRPSLLLVIGLMQ